MENTILGHKREKRSDDENSDYNELSKATKVRRRTQEDKCSSLVWDDNSKAEKDNKETIKDQNKQKEIVKEVKESNEANKTIIEKSKETSKPEPLFPGGIGLFSSKPTENLFSWNFVSNKDNIGFSSFSTTNNTDFFSQKETKVEPNKKEADPDANSDEDDGDDKGKKEDDNNDHNKDDLFTNDPQAKEDNQTNTITQEASSLYDKLISKNIDNLYLFNKEENKFVSKGKGFISLETSKEKEKKSAVIVFRNQMGTKIVEGYLNKSLSKFESYVKNYNNVSSIFFIHSNKDNQIEMRNIKIPFKLEADFNEVKTAFNQAMSYLNDDKTESGIDNKASSN